MKLKPVLLTSLAAGAGYMLFDWWQRSSLDLRGKVILITGGSRGLGLATAREFGARGSVVAICARDQAELDRAQADLTSRGAQAHAFLCDITQRDQVQALIAAVTKRLGPVDVLVNNAGLIRVGPLAEMTVQDFEQAMAVMFWGTLYTTLAVLPHMQATQQGSIVNVTSIGGKVSIPHLLPYSCAKFATVALSEGLRTELAADGIRVTTIVPGLLRTGSHLRAEFKGQQEDEYTWFALGAATPIVSIAAERAARSIVNATVRGDSEKVLSVPATVLARMQGLLPGLTADLLSIANKMLPSATGQTSATLSGEDVERGFNSRLWKAATSPGQAAAESLNEVPAGG